jgi:hypothetical protein
MVNFPRALRSTLHFFLGYRNWNFTGTFRHNTSFYFLTFKLLFIFIPKDLRISICLITRKSELNNIFRFYNMVWLCKLSYPSVFYFRSIFFQINILFSLRYLQTILWRYNPHRDSRMLLTENQYAEFNINSNSTEQGKSVGRVLSAVWMGKEHEPVNWVYRLKAKSGNPFYFLNLLSVKSVT